MSGSLPPTAANFCTIQDGPQSTLCGHSHQISALANRFLEREAGEFNNPVDARVVLTGLALIVGLGAYSLVPT
jgi:hypothetical protein